MQSSLLLRLNDDTNIRVYKDNWVPRSLPVKIISPLREGLDDFLVSQLIYPNFGWWDCSLINNLFVPFKAQKIKAILLCLTHQDNCMTWPRSRDGCY